MSIVRSPSCLILLVPTLLLASTGAAQEPVRFNRDVRPILADRCFHCHGPDAGSRKAKLRLDRADGTEGAYRVRKGRAAIRPGAPGESSLWERINADDEDEVMPPPESHKAPLSSEQKAVLRNWIEKGAPYEDHWAFVVPRRPTVPEVKTRPGAGAIDRFVLRKLEAVGARPSPPADRRTLVRRVTFDLTGLPPTREEIASFLSDRRDDAWERLVDGLIARPQFGEHLARHWLDAVRFADTNGIHHDHFRDMSPYRDWVIRSINENLPYDRFLTDQLAGDLHVDATTDQLIASGFNRLHMIIDRGTRLPEESFARNVIDRVTAVGTAMMGLTVECAVCHDHKYDPITQRDFYGLYAFFNNLDANPETGGRSGADFRRGLQPPYISFATEEQERELARLESGVVEAKSALNAAREAKKDTKPLQKALREARRRRDDFLVRVPAAMVMKERKEPRPAHVLIRGDYARVGEPVARATPAFLPAMTVDGLPTRLDLARWLTSGQHPLTARVAVNRIWQQFFGVGLVKTAEDFGTQGEWPTHPELLDHLAVTFVASGWDVKALVKSIVMSETYRQTSAASPEAFTADPENRLLARGSRFRMDAEMIRDQVLATSGLLVPKLYGKSVKPPQPAGIWKAVTLPDSYPRTFRADEGDAIYRRSVYTFWKRGLPPPQMTILNAPTREYCAVRRERTNTPLQALLLMNETEYLKAARHLAARTLVEAPSATPDELLDIFCETITSRLPDENERKTLLDSLRDLEAAYGAKPKLAKRLCGDEEAGEGRTRSELAAWTMVVSALYNLDITKTRE